MGVPTHPAFCHGEQPGSLAHVNQGTFREGLTFARIVPKLQDSFRFLVFAWAIPLPIALDVRSGFHLRLRVLLCPFVVASRRKAELSTLLLARSGRV